jgi:hypothetical protein
MGSADPEQRESLRADLLDYNRDDVQALVLVVGKIREIVASSGRKLVERAIGKKRRAKAVDVKVHDYDDDYEGLEDESLYVWPYGPE